jgi:hypothetical protein
MSCPTSPCLSRPEPALNAPGVARCRWCRWASMRSLHAERVASRRGPRAAAVSTCPRRAASSTVAVSSSSAAVLSCSCCTSMYQTSARSREWRSELARHRRPALCVRTSRDPGRTRLYPSSPAVGVRSVLFATIEYARRVLEPVTVLDHPPPQPAPMTASAPAAMSGTPRRGRLAMPRTSRPAPRSREQGAGTSCDRGRRTRATQRRLRARRAPTTPGYARVTT